MLTNFHSTALKARAEAAETEADELREALQEARATVAGVEGAAAAAQQVCIPKKPGETINYIQKRPGNMGETQAKARLEDEGLRLEEKTALAETRLRYAWEKSAI